MKRKKKYSVQNELSKIAFFFISKDTEVFVSKTSYHFSVHGFFLESELEQNSMVPYFIEEELSDSIFPEKTFLIAYSGVVCRIRSLFRMNCQRLMSFFYL